MAANATELVDAVAEPTRRAIVERLVERPSSVTELARELPISRSAVSQHLQVLKAVGLVADQARGTSRIYHVEPEALALIREYFDAFWRRSLDAFKHATEQPERPERPERPEEEA